MSKGLQEAGRPWPDAAHGEVVGPTGARCYKANTAAGFFRKTDRQFRNWLKNKEKYPELRLDGSSDHPYYLLADGVEELAKRLSSWPPPTIALPDPLDEDAWPELFERQGRDLEAERQARKSVESDLSQAKTDLHELRQKLATAEYEAAQLSVALEAVAKATARRHRSVGSTSEPDDQSREVP